MTLIELLLLAQTEGAAPGAAVASGGGEPMGGLVNMIVWMAILFGFLWFFMIRPQQREQRRRQEMWDGIKVYDKVVTVGGVHGVVTQINPDEGTLLLRVDESANVKLRLEISCVAIVENGEKKTEESK